VKFEGMYRELYYIITRQSQTERVALFYEWFLKEKENEEE
tara:strand:+ start:791 stop:910 length:120 start_codon:yes stop_codon:yes gene_type:complete